MAKRPGTTTASRPLSGALALLGALALAAPAAVPASASAPPSTPAAFALSAVGTSGALRLSGTPGRELHGAVRLRNVSGHLVTVRLQRADIRTASNGNADYVTRRLSDTGRWLHLAAKTVRLAPAAEREVAFTVRIPARTRGASHYAGIVAVDAADLAAAATHKPSKKRTFTFARINRQALPVTIRLPGRLWRTLALRSLRISVQPAGAGLVLRLRPGGTELMASARVELRVRRGSRTVLTHASTLGQLFPGSGLKFRIPWAGRPTAGSYRVTGVIRPKRAAAIYINRTIEFTPANARQLQRTTAQAAAHSAEPGTPAWVWLALAIAAALLAGLSIAVWRLARRPPTSVTQ